MLHACIHQNMCKYFECLHEFKSIIIEQSDILVQVSGGKKMTSWTIQIELQQRIEAFNDDWNSNYSMFSNERRKKNYFFICECKCWIEWIAIRKTRIANRRLRAVIKYKIINKKTFHRMLHAKYISFNLNIVVALWHSALGNKVRLFRIRYSLTVFDNNQ